MAAIVASYPRMQEDGWLYSQHTSVLATYASIVGAAGSCEHRGERATRPRRKMSYDDLISDVTIE